MSQIKWALAALLPLFLSACDGGGPSGDGHNTDDTDTGTQIQPGTGGINVHAEFEGNLEECFVNVNGQELGPTESEIMNLAPGLIEFQLGSMESTTLDGIPLHETDTGKYLLGAGSVNVVEGQVTPVTVEMTEAPQYHCKYTDCGYPYEGGSCSGSVNSDDPQWIVRGPDGHLSGSQNNSFGGVGGVDVYVDIEKGTITVTPLDSMLSVSGAYWNADQSFGYVTMDSSVAVSVECPL